MSRSTATSRRAADPACRDRNRPCRGDPARHAPPLELVADRQLRPGLDPHADRRRASTRPASRPSSTRTIRASIRSGRNLAFRRPLGSTAPVPVQCRQRPARRQRHPVRSPGRAPAHHLQARRRGDRLLHRERSGPASPTPPTFAHRRQRSAHARPAADQPPPPFLDAIGDLTANFNFAVNQLSDFGRSGPWATASPGSRSRPSPCSGR